MYVTLVLKPISTFNPDSRLIWTLTRAPIPAIGDRARSRSSYPHAPYPSSTHRDLPEIARTNTSDAVCAKESSARCGVAALFSYFGLCFTLSMGGQGGGEAPSAGTAVCSHVARLVARRHDLVHATPSGYIWLLRGWRSTHRSSPTALNHLARPLASCSCRCNPMRGCADRRASRWRTSQYACKALRSRRRYSRR